MKKKQLIVFALVCAFVSTMTTSCISLQTTVPPKAINTVNPVSLDELNLKREDYQILQTITAESNVILNYKSSTDIEIKDEAGEFKVKCQIINGTIFFKEQEGVMKLGYLSRDYTSSSTPLHPEEIVRRTAIYRLINTAQENGADGVIEPTISTNIEQVGKNSVMYKTTVSGKIIKLKTDK